MTSRPRLEASTMLLTAAVFAALILLIGLFTAYAAGETRRILKTGRKATVTVVSKHRDSKKQSPTVEVRLDEVPGEKPFYRTLLGEEWERVQPGDTLPYVYEPGDPRGGVLGEPPAPAGVPCFFAATSVFVVPFLAIGIVLKVRERRLKTAS